MREPNPGGGGEHRAPDLPPVGNASFKDLTLCIPVTVATNPLDTTRQGLEEQILWV